MTVFFNVCPDGIAQLFVTADATPTDLDSKALGLSPLPPSRRFPVP